jgi:N-methylhydantoinase B
MNDATQIRWDGRTYPYIPTEPLQIDPSLGLHEAVAQDLDPITFEVVRYAMWNINVEQGNTLLRVSGSPIAAYGHDFNPCLLDERGNFVFFGPFLQYLSSASSSAVKWTLENRSTNPGIRDGDIFLTNDPWIGATHQTDVTVFAPLFWEGRLFCWFANTLHQWDLGGTTPGSFNPISQDVFWEAGCIPPLRIVEQGTLRRDLEDEYTRRSRMPELVALDLRAQITACNVARERMREMLCKYGPATVKGVMKRLQDNSESAFVTRLATIPDGSWSEQSWIELSREGDRHVYRNVLRVTKRGDRLIFDNEGTDPQIGSINCTAVAWKGAIASMISAQMLYDQMFVIEGAYRHIDFQPVPGTITCALFPAGVISAPPVVLLQTIGLAGLIISRMLCCSSDADLRSEVQSCMGTLMFPIDAIAGTDQRGNGFASFLLDPVGGALGALSWRDGVNTGGWPWDLQSTMPNVEDNEIFYPLLYLWRREIRDSGGAGRFRGGNSAEIAYVLHDTARMEHHTTGGHTVIPGNGLFGGDPTSRTRFMMVRGARALEKARADGRMPVGLEELAGEHQHVPPKAGGVLQGPDDVFSLAWTSAGGLGDPLQRDPAAVLRDIEDGNVSPAWAHARHGVCLDEHGTIDAAATAARREALRRERLGTAVGGCADCHRIAAQDHELRVADSLVMARDGGGSWYVCACCRAVLGPGEGNYKSGCVVRVRPVGEVGLAPIDPHLIFDEDIVYREYCCPGCGLLLQGDFGRSGDDHLWDIRLHAIGPAGAAGQPQDPEMRT